MLELVSYNVTAQAALEDLRPVSPGQWPGVQEENLPHAGVYLGVQARNGEERFRVKRPQGDG